MALSGLAQTRFCSRGGFFNVVDLVNKPDESEVRVGRAGRLAAYLMRHDLVVLDELGYLSCGQSCGELRFHLVGKLYERISVIVVTRLVFGEGSMLPGGAKVITALRDLRHRRNRQR